MTVCLNVNGKIVTNCINSSAVSQHKKKPNYVNTISFYPDNDDDGYGSGDKKLACTTLVGYVENNNDCNDGNKKINPGTDEICGNATDDNCNGATDENCIACPCDFEGAITAFKALKPVEKCTGYKNDPDYYQDFIKDTNDDYKYGQAITYYAAEQGSLHGLILSVAGNTCLSGLNDCNTTTSTSDGTTPDEAKACKDIINKWKASLP